VSTGPLRGVLERKDEDTVVMRSWKKDFINMKKGHYGERIGRRIQEKST